MPPTKKRTRAEGQEATRRRILDAAIEVATVKRRFGVREIADAASVTVQTVYAHFHSKGGLLAAVIQDVAGTRGLVAGLTRVWRHASPRAQLEDMVTVTFDFWHRARPLIGFMLEARRTDPDFASQVRAVDASRLSDLETICTRLRDSGELRRGLKPGAAAALVFGLTTPYVYEELVGLGRMSYASASRLIVDVVCRAVLN